MTLAMATTAAAVLLQCRRMLPGAARSLAFSRSEEGKRVMTRIVAMPKKQPKKSVWLTSQRLKHGGEFWASTRAITECVSDVRQEMATDVELDSAVPSCLMDIGAQLNMSTVAESHASCRYGGDDRSMTALETQLFNAVVDDDAKAVQELCSGVSPRIHHPIHGGTPLHLAAWHGHSHIVQILLGLGSDVNAGAANGSTPLHWASGAGQQRAATILLEAGADPMRFNGQTPVHWAAESGHDPMVQLLSRWSPLSVIIPDENGLLPSKVAFKAGKWSTYELLTRLESEDYFPVCVSLQHQPAMSELASETIQGDVLSRLK